MFKKLIFTLLTVLGLTALSLTAAPVHAADPAPTGGTDLGEAFNFFGVKCLVPDSNPPKYATDTPLGKLRACQQSDSDGKASISLLDQAIIFLYQLGPILAVVVVIWGGYLYYNSVFSGDDSRALKTVRAGVIGLSIILGVPIVYSVFNTLSNAGIGGSQSFFNVLLATLVTQIIAPIANVLIALGAALAVLSFVYAGYQYLFGQAEKGRKALTNAFIGLAVVLGSVAVVALVQLVSGFILPKSS